MVEKIVVVAVAVLAAVYLYRSIFKKSGCNCSSGGGGSCGKK